ncbi:hypothetical protein BDY24DRAFT_416491 [Mrakia frigida]|uniref:uncharacterized protein n=1 Tax=Mrakia frigida TaxID=29902 RepID=UPI003FCC2037
MSLSSSETKTILVVGATGRQGRAVVRALSSFNASSASSEPPMFRILALTRTPSSSLSQSLLSLSLPHVQLHQGNLDFPAAIFESAGGFGAIWGVFSMQNNRQVKGGVEGEVRQGKQLAKEAERRGVKCFVYSGVYVGREGAKSGVPQFDSKLEIEKYLKSSDEVGNLPWIILEPVYFMDNLHPSTISTFEGKLLSTMLVKGTFSHPQTDRFQLVALSDLGRVVAKIFQSPSSYLHRTLPLAGDDLTLPDLLSTHRTVLGHDLPTTFGPFASLVKLCMVDLRTMFKREVGFEMKTWEEFLRRECLGHEGGSKTGLE